LRAQAARCKAGDVALALVYVNAGPSQTRLLQMLAYRWRIYTLTKCMREHCFDGLRTFAVFPDLIGGEVVAELGTPAGAYASRHMTFSPPSAIKRAVLAALKLLSGCLPTAGAIFVIGNRL
jgi:hypothetical protein